MILNQVNSLEQLDQICHKCCFEINYADKTAAGEKVSEFIKNLIQNIYQFQHLLSGQSSETTVFVLCQYLTKFVKDIPLKTLTTIVSVLLRCIKNWYQPQTKQIMRGWNVLQIHTVNSIWNLMGEAIKKVIMIVVPQKSQLFQQMIFQNQLGLIFWRHVTKIAGTIDTEFGFSTTQNIILYYQDQVMPKIIKYMNPYFSSLTETIKMNQLVILQQNLVLSGNTDSQSKVKRLLSFSDQELLIAKLVLQLIQQILQFPYNISYAQYDTDYYTSTQNTVYFSCSASDSILKSDFYDSLFFLTERFVIEQPSHPLLVVCLNCLKRVLMARISSFDQELKDSFVKKSVVGITRLMNILKNAEQSFQIIQLNNKLLGNIPLRKFRKYEQFLLWLPLIEIHLHKNLFSRPFRFDDKQYFECCSLLEKISLSFVNEKLMDYKQTFQAITQKLFSELITKLLSQQQSLYLFMDVQNLKQFRQACDEFFDTIKDFMFYNTLHYTILLSRLQAIIFEKVKNMEPVPVNALFSLNLLISRLFNSSSLNQITSSLHADSQSTSALKSIYKNQILFVNEYFKDFRNRYSDIYLQYSTIILLETITTQLCNNISISASDTVQIISYKPSKKPETYSISNSSKLLSFIQFPVENTEQFMNTLLCYISNYINVDDKKIVIFALDIMNSCLIRIKWSVKRKHFKKLTVVKNMIKFCAISRTVSSQNKQHLKCRMQMTKLVATVAFDDCLDSYKRQIDAVFSGLSTSSILSLIYQLRGIVQQIDSSMIYKYFLQKGSVLLVQIMQTVSSNYLQNEQVLKNSLKLCQFYFYNLLQRISSKGRTAMLICQLLIQCIPSWQIIFDFLLKELFDQPDKYISSACHLLGIFCKLIQGDYINLIHIHEVNNKINNYLYYLLRFANKISRSELLNYQKMKKQMNKFCNCVFNHLNQYIYNMNTSQDIILFYCGLYSFSLALLFQQIDSQIPYLQKNKDLDTILDFVNNGMRYQYQSLIQVHESYSNQRAKLFKAYLQQKILQMILTYIKVMVVSNVSAWRVDKLAVFIKESFLVYQEHTNQLCLKIMSLYPNSSFQLLQQFTKSCLTSEKPFWYSKFNDWLDSAKGVEQIERMSILVQ